MWKPAYPPSASSIVALEKARPTTRGSGSLTVTRRWAVASSFDAASGRSNRSSRTSTSAKRSLPPSTSNSSSSARAALASMSSPVSTSVIVLRKPPTSLSATFSVSGGGLPRTPVIATRCSPSGVSAMVSKWVVTSGPR